MKNGGAKEDRTPDLFAASEALSQLSYGPIAHKREKSLVPVRQGKVKRPRSDDATYLAATTFFNFTHRQPVF